MSKDPFWKHKGFWVAVMATVPLAFAILAKNVTQELVIAVIGAWAAYFTGAKVRPTVPTSGVQEILARQQQRIRELSTNPAPAGGGKSTTV